VDIVANSTNSNNPTDEGNALAYLNGTSPNYFTDLLISDTGGGPVPPVVPEPATLALTLGGALAIGIRRLTSR
jgi:hypothetical protein